MVRSALAALAAIVLVGASLMPDDAFARRGGGGYRGGGGFHGGAVGVRGGAVGVRGGRYGVAGRGYAVAGRGYYGRPVARAAVRRGVYGAAAVGAAAAGAYGYYGNSCYQDGYGNTICPQQYPY